MVNRYGNCTALCLCFLVLGIVIGGCIDAAAPHPNHIHMTVTPYGKVNVSPMSGDMLDWAAYDPNQTLTIQFDSFFGSPCDPGGDPDTCTYNPNNAAPISPYTCVGQAVCPDPGVGPPGSNGGDIRQNAFLVLIRKVAAVFGSLFLTIDRTFDLAPTLVRRPVQPASASGQAASTGGSRTASIVGPDGVKCSSNTTTVQTSPIYANPGDTIVWLSATKDNFTLAMPGICTQSTSTPALIQQCTLPATVAANNYSYTATTVGCGVSGSETITVPIPTSPTQKQ